MSILGFAVAAAAFGAATGAVQAAPEPEVKTLPATSPASARFFAPGPSAPVRQHAPVPVAALLLEIESHVRVEQAAAESFLATPNFDLLHTRTISPLVQ